MKRILLVSFAAIFAMNLAFAQPNAEKRIREARENFFTEALQLTPQESKAFWPLLYQYEEDDKQLEKEHHLNGKIELMSDQEVEQLIDNTLLLKEKQLALRRSYVGKLRSVLPVRKVAMLPRVERQFKRKLLGRVKNNRRQQQGHKERKKQRPE